MWQAEKSASPEDIVHIHSLIPLKARIDGIIAETPDIKTFLLSNLQDEIPFHLNPGQLAMLSLFGVGEGIFSATDTGKHLAFSIKRVGALTAALHECEPGQIVGIRGPYGNGFPLEMCQGKNLFFIGGGIGLAPVRSLITYVLEHRNEFGHLHLLYGSRTPQDLVFREDLLQLWPSQPDFQVTLTVDKSDGEWQGNVGFVPTILADIQPKTDHTVCILCGPPAMIRPTLTILENLGFLPNCIFTTLEMRMKCGIGKCGRCNIGACYVCLDGPVFSLAQLKQTSGEY